MAVAAIEVVLTWIGTVRSPWASSADPRAGATARLEILPEFREALEGIEPGAKILVLFWMHRVRAEGRFILRVHPGGDTDHPIRGVFATRSPLRPNPIGATAVTVVSRRGNDLWVEGLDALDESPILDLKLETGRAT